MAVIVSLKPDRVPPLADVSGRYEKRDEAIRALNRAGYIVRSPRVYAHPLYHGGRFAGTITPVPNTGEHIPDDKGPSEPPQGL